MSEWNGITRGDLVFGWVPRYTPRVWTQAEIDAWLPSIEERLLWMGIGHVGGMPREGVSLRVFLHADRVQAFARQINHGPWDRIVRRRAAAFEQRRHDAEIHLLVDHMLGHQYPMADDHQYRLQDLLQEHDFLEGR